MSAAQDAPDNAARQADLAAAHLVHGDAEQAQAAAGTALGLERVNRSPVSFWPALRLRVATAARASASQ